MPEATEYRVPVTLYVIADDPEQAFRIAFDAVRTAQGGSDTIKGVLGYSAEVTIVD